MIKQISIKNLSISVATSILCGALFIITVPILALFVLDIFISVVSVFDPMHQGGNIEKVWSAFIGIIIIQILFPIVASIAVGVAISYLTEYIKTGIAYLYGTGVSLIIYCIFQAISVMFVGLLAGELVVISWFLTSMAIVGALSPFIGLILVGINLKLSRKP